MLIFFGSILDGALPDDPPAAADLGFRAASSWSARLETASSFLSAAAGDFAAGDFAAGAFPRAEARTSSTLILLGSDLAAGLAAVLDSPPRAAAKTSSTDIAAPFFPSSVRAFVKAEASCFTGFFTGAFLGAAVALAGLDAGSLGTG